MEAAIMASMGGAPPQAAPPPPTPSLVTSQQLGAAPTAALPVESEAASRATLAVIEMGFEPAQVSACLTSFGIRNRGISTTT